MKIEPQSELNFYSDVEVSRPLAFSTKAKLDAYFNSKKVIALADFTTIKKQTSRIRVDIPMKSLQRCNYLSFKNPAFENKVFYARIFDMNYINNECTEVAFGINYWYTFGHDVKIMSGLIEREHLSEETFKLAEDNPFMRIAEFETPENLQISKALEPYRVQFASHQGENSLFGDYCMGLHMLEDRFFYADDGSRTDLIDSTMLIVSITEPIPPSDDEKDWWDHFLSAFMSGSTVTQAELAMFGPLNGLSDPHELSYNTSFFHSFIAPFYGQPTTITSGSNFPLPYNVMFMTYTTFNQLMEHMTLWGATSAVVSVYAMPTHMLLAALHMGNSWKGSLDEIKIDLTPFYSYMGYKSEREEDEIESKKLYQFPFSYMRVMTPNGDEKEYHYEQFSKAADDETLKPTFKLGGNLVSVPRVEVLPKNYKTLGTALNMNNVTNTFSENVNEKMTFKAFPQVPYTTDAYLSYLSGIAADLMKGNTKVNALGYKNQAAMLESQSFATDMAGATELYNTAKDVFTGFKRLAGTAGRNIEDAEAGFMEYTKGGGTYGAAENLAMQGVSHLVNLNNLATQQDVITRNQQILLKEAQMYNQSDELSVANLENNAIAQNYSCAKDAFAVSDYHAGTVDGIETFEDVSSKDFLLQHVTLRRDILMRYDRYFKAYGYNSGRYGVPRIADFIQGRTADEYAPHFSKLEKDHNGNDLYVTYIKTKALDIYNPYGYKEIDSYIKAMFEGGQQFINGDKLVGGENNG